MKLRFFGDSVCNGQHVSINKTFPCLIANDNPDWTVTVSARNGETTREALERITHDVTMDPPDILYIQYGINDANKWSDGLGINRVTGPAFRANLREIIVRAQKAGIKRVILGTNHPIKKEYPENIKCVFTFEEMNKHYNEDIKTTGEILNCEVVDHHYDTGVLDDGVHLSEEGHLAYYQRIKDIL